MSLNKTCSKVSRYNHLSDAFPTQNGLKYDALSPMLCNFTLEYVTR